MHLLQFFHVFLIQHLLLYSVYYLPFLLKYKLQDKSNVFSENVLTPSRAVTLSASNSGHTVWEFPLIASSLTLRIVSLFLFDHSSRRGGLALTDRRCCFRTSLGPEIYAMGQKHRIHAQTGKMPLYTMHWTCQKKKKIKYGMHLILSRLL